MNDQETAAIKAFIESLVTKTANDMSRAMSMMQQPGVKGAILDAARAYHEAMPPILPQGEAIVTHKVAATIPPIAPHTTPIFNLPNGMKISGENVSFENDTTTITPATIRIGKNEYIVESLTIDHDKRELSYPSINGERTVWKIDMLDAQATDAQARMNASIEGMST